jgi:hypothetical protein
MVHLVQQLLTQKISMRTEGITALANALVRHNVDPARILQLFQANALQSQVLNDAALATVLLQGLIRADNFDTAIKLFDAYGATKDAHMLNTIVRGVRTRSQLRLLTSLLRASNIERNGATSGEVVAAYARCGVHSQAVKQLANFDGTSGKTLTPETATLLVRSASALRERMLVSIKAIHREVVAQGVHQTEGYTRALLYALGNVVRRGLFKARKVVQAAHGPWAIPDRNHVSSRCGGAVELALSLYGEIHDNELPLSSGCCEGMMQIAGLLGDVDLADRVLADMATHGVHPTVWLHKHAMLAYGSAGDLPKMMDHLAAVPDAQCDLQLLTRAIHFAGHHHRDVDTAMTVYDRVLALGYQPSQDLNDVLIHVVKVDPISVLLNAKR